MINVLALVATAAAADPASAMAGFYRSHQIEIGAALELEPSGRFRYQLDYGAVSEAAEGVWTAEPDGIRLTSSPMPREPRFVVLRDDPAPAGELQLTLEEPAAGWGGRFDAIVSLQGSGELVRAAVDSDGRVDLPSNVRVAEVQLLAPILGEPSEKVAVDPAIGHHLHYRFEPNDFGLVAFQGEHVRLDKSALELVRYGARIRLERVQP